MSRSTLGIWTAAATLSLTGLIAASTAATRARHRRDAELARLHTAAGLAGDYLAVKARLRSADPGAKEHEAAGAEGGAGGGGLVHTQEGLAARVAVVLSDSGLDPACVSSFAVEESAIPAPEDAPSAHAVRHRVARLQLVNLTLPQLGAFLQSWRRLLPAWIATSIDVAPAVFRGDSPAAAPGTDLPIRVAIVFESVFPAGQVNGGQP